MIEEMLQRIDDMIRTNNLTWTRKGNVLTIALNKGQRKQRVDITRRGDDYVFTSPVLRADDIPDDSSLEELAYRAWRRNTITEFVSFTFDADDALVGTIEQPSASLDQLELRGYVEILATECDRFQYALCGLADE